MDKRARLIGAMFGLVVAYVGATELVYPKLIVPVLTYDKRIAEAEEAYAELEHEQKKVDRAKLAYKAYASRVGSMDTTEVANAMEARINDLLDRHGIEDRKISKGLRPNKSRKTGLMKLTMTVSGKASLQSAVEFLRDLAMLPQLVHMSTVKLVPADSSSRTKKKDKVSLVVSLRILVLPQKRKMVGRIISEKLEQPELFDRCRFDDADAYAVVWDADPFSEYVKPVKRGDPPKTTTPTKRTARKTTPKPPASKRWKNVSKMQLCMALLGGDGTTGRDEFMIYNTSTKKKQYAKVGDDFDGGILLFVHQRGALVGREDGDFVYPLGARLNQPLKIEEATEFPAIRAAHARVVAQRAVEEAEAESDQPGEKAGETTVDGAKTADAKAKTDPEPTGSNGDLEEAKASAGRSGGDTKDKAKRAAGSRRASAKPSRPARRSTGGTSKRKKAPAPR